MNTIKIFENEQFGKVRIAMSENNEPFFCLADVCGVIGIANARNVRSRLEEDDVRQMDTIDSLGRNQQVTFITESGLYDVIIRSDSEKAKPFRKWVTSEVLPSIRKHGVYMTNETLEKALTSPDFCIIPNYSRYVIDTYGNVYSLNYNKTGKIKIMKQSKNRYGYMQIELFDDNKESKLLSVHRLVAISFIPSIKGKDYVNHIDGNRSNNHVSNLEWCSLSENAKHSYNIIKTQSYDRLSTIGKAAAKKLLKFTEQEIDSIREKHNLQHVSFRKLAMEYNCGKTVIERIINHVTYTC